MCLTFAGFYNLTKPSFNTIYACRAKVLHINTVFEYFQHFAFQIKILHTKLQFTNH